MIKEVQDLELARRDLIKEIYTVFVNFHEKIFKRKELLKYKTSAALLEQERDILEGTNRFLTTGNSMNLTQLERRMILNAIESEVWWAGYHLPPYKAHPRIMRKEIRGKFKLSIKKEDEVQEDDETKGADE